MNLHDHYKAITVVLDKDGTANELAKKLKKDHGLLTGNIQTARGTGDPQTKRSFLHQFEKDLLTVVVPTEQAEVIFNYIYRETGMGKRFGGFMYQAPLSHTSIFALPELDEG